MENNIPSPNPAVFAILKDPVHMADVMYQSGTLVLNVWQEIVAVDSSALRDSGYVYLTVGGVKMDRVAAEVVIGEGTPRGGYGASHEFGIGIHPRSRKPPTQWMPQDPVDDLVKALAIVDSLP